jgi:hypothetical protein
MIDKSFRVFVALTSCFRGDRLRRGDRLFVFVFSCFRVFVALTSRFRDFVAFGGARSSL